MFQTTLPLLLSTEPEDCDALARRRVVRALVDARRALEDRAGDDCPPRGEAADLLVGLVSRLRLTALETVEALGAEILADRLFPALVPLDLPVDELVQWAAAHEGQDLGPINLGVLHGPR